MEKKNGINTESVKNIKSNMERVHELLEHFQTMEEMQADSKTVTVYNAAEKQMRYAYKMIIEEMNKMLNDVDCLGVYCGELGIREYNRIECKTFEA